jgi:hypothetical protein
LYFLASPRNGETFHNPLYNMAWECQIKNEVLWIFSGYSLDYLQADDILPNPIV